MPEALDLQQNGNFQQAGNHLGVKIFVDLVYALLL
jgi:hypothetical protein